MDKNIFTYILIILVILSFVFNPFMKKKAAISLSATEFLIFNHFLITILLILYILLMIFSNKLNIKFYNKLSYKEIYWCLFASIISIIGSLAFIYLLQNEDVTFIMPNIQPIVLILTAIFGYLIFKEKIGLYKMIGYILIILGFLFINYEKLYQKLL